MRGSLPHLLAAAVLLLLPRLAGAQDTPDQAPARPAEPPSRSLASAAAGETQVSYHLPAVTYRVDSGFDLDQYLFRTSTPIDFTIDLKGLKPEREAPCGSGSTTWTCRARRPGAAPRSMRSRSTACRSAT